MEDRIGRQCRLAKTSATESVEIKARAVEWRVRVRAPALPLHDHLLLLILPACCRPPLVLDQQTQQQAKMQARERTSIMLSSGGRVLGRLGQIDNPGPARKVGGQILGHPDPGFLLVCFELRHRALGHWHTARTRLRLDALAHHRSLCVRLRVRLDVLPRRGWRHVRRRAWLERVVCHAGMSVRWRGCMCRDERARDMIKQAARTCARLAAFKSSLPPSSCRFLHRHRREQRSCRLPVPLGRGRGEVHTGRWRWNTGSPCDTQMVMIATFKDHFPSTPAAELPSNLTSRTSSRQLLLLAIRFAKRSIIRLGHDPEIVEGPTQEIDFLPQTFSECSETERGEKRKDGEDRGSWHQRVRWQLRPHPRRSPPRLTWCSCALLWWGSDTFSTPQGVSGRAQPGQGGKHQGAFRHRPPEVLWWFPAPPFMLLATFCCV